ncbi:hypothetical protein SmJEL517_g01876 [Synchytrium microbalum]|uniref:HpcH/HpaI aldolase/citrate lyase domain-containing protein n=1 Tax=Synchytrium microbalum TaxID=1806994 RepID=A0A507C833_9FUNG|nr:uncharacterized protein SmJEL517_g01876 [Synchytrium microbalum]TPX35772.1 hypothetical protein SmJEL517_g01876 [Synchytrium microbalum]
MSYGVASTSNAVQRLTVSLRAKLASGKPCIGAWLDIPNPAVARVISRLGFDWCLIDMEHAPMTIQIAAEMVAAIGSSSDCSPIVRVPGHGVEWFKWALDAGAHGIIIPMVNTKEQCEAVVSHCRYPPEGTRSAGVFYAQYAFSSLKDQANGVPTYLAEANREILVMPQIESKTALENVDEILSVPGVDLAFVGPTDLHLSLNLAPSAEGREPIFLEALEKIKASAKKNNVKLGIFATGGAASKQRIAEGFQFVNACTDLAMVLKGCNEALRDAKM